VECVLYFIQRYTKWCYRLDKASACISEYLIMGLNDAHPSPVYFNLKSKIFIFIFRCDVHQMTSGEVHFGILEMSVFKLQ